MIYFTEISKNSDGTKSEPIEFQFYLKELPESIKTPYETKVNHIQYNGGFVTNQIIGVYQKEIEWEGCFYGTYETADGKRYSAKERSDLIRKFMGRPIRVGFPVPKGGDTFMPGEDSEQGNKPGRLDENLGGLIGVFIITEYEQEIVNYSDVNYRIKLVPHMRQEKIKPTETETAGIKLATENIDKAANNIIRATPKPARGPLKRGIKQAVKAKGHKEQLGPQPAGKKPQNFGVRGQMWDSKNKAAAKARHKPGGGH